MNNRFKVYLLFTILYALLIFYLSSISSIGDPRAILNFLPLESLKSVLKSIGQSNLRFLLYSLYIIYEYLDKVEHIIQYAILGFLLYHTLKNSPYATSRNYAPIFAVIIGVAYGATDEFHQFFVPGRTTSIWDLLADSIGILIAQALIFVQGRLLNGRLSNFSKKRMPAIMDLKLTVILIIASIIFILVPPYNQTFLRIILALPLLLFLPGYLFILVMFPKQGELSPIERFTLSIGLSIAIFVFDGFALNYTSWGFRPNSIVISLSIVMGLFLIAAYFQRWRLGENGYGLSYKDLISFYHTIRSKETETGPEYDPALEKMLIKTMIVAILLVTAMLVYAKVTNEPEKFTALYILGANGKAEDYPTEVYIGNPTTILVGIENYEHAPVNYSLQVNLGGKILKEQHITLNHNAKWLNNVTFVPQLTSSVAFAGTNKSKLEFLLLKDNQSYRSVHLLVNVSLDSVKFADLPNIINGDMESEEGWRFTGSVGNRSARSSNITGKYTNSTANSSFKSYEVNFTGRDAESHGRIYQNLTTLGDARAILSFDVKDSEYTNVSYDILKQVMLDEQVIWESGVGGKNSSWEHVEVPVFFSGNNTIAFQVYSKYGANRKVTIWWDNVQLRPYDFGDKTKPIRTPVRKKFEFNFDVRGAPLMLEKSMKIDGFNFPGFHYNLSDNKSYEELNINISDNNQIDTGNATYITRANGSELYLLGSRYKILSKDMPTNLSRILETYPNKTLNLSETWDLGGTYSLRVDLISSKGDSAMLELRKGWDTLDSRLVSKGDIYEYRANIGEFSVTIFKANVDSISGDSMHLTNIELYSDAITILSPGTILGDFEVTNASSNEVDFKNSYPFELKDKTVILNGSMGLSLQGNMLYPYATGVPLRGVPQYIYYGRWMNITGLNYPGFYLENGIPYEELSMYFSSNGLVDTGQAMYRSEKHSGKLSFLGNTFELIYPDRPGYISNETINSNITLYDNETKDIGQYKYSFRKVDDTSIKLDIRKFGEREQKLLNETIESNFTFFPDVYYEMFTGKSDNVRKSNVLNTGDTFEYWIEYKEDREYKAIAGELMAINNNSIELNVREYDIPFEILPGKSFGEFDVESVTSDAITLRNTKPLRFELGENKEILNGALTIEVSPEGYIAYPTRSNKG